MVKEKNRIFPHVVHPLNEGFYICLTYDKEEDSYRLEHMERTLSNVINIVNRNKYSHSPKRLSRDYKKIDKLMYRNSFGYARGIYSTEDRDKLASALKKLKEQCIIYETSW